MGALIKSFFFKRRYTVDSPTDKLWWSVIQVASCRLLHSGDSLAAAKTAASSNGPSLFQGTRPASLAVTWPANGNKYSWALTAGPAAYVFPTGSLPPVLGHLTSLGLSCAHTSVEGWDGCFFKAVDLKRKVGH